MSRFLPVNVHPIERVLRVGLGVVLVGAAYAGTIGAWGYLGLVPIVTGVLSSCPLYTVLGISTCPTRTSRTAN
ncbi:DUF2892 domain-containing protein [Luteitalea sp.]|jgi:hypothetical protein|uniref:DUF2892 domain-containing protein n=1 Tax=Luteitalea sp. TaxID=2004800 RepID=UPI0037CA618F